jgi:glutathionyl-hydroquinone reductase
MTSADPAPEVEPEPSRCQVSAAAAPPAESELGPATGSRVGPVRFASPIDAFMFGEHRITSPLARPRPVRQFTGRITADGSSGYRAEPNRYHLYAGPFCPRSHRATITLALTGLADVVSASYVDGLRDGRGWAFRERTGADPVNGFTLVRQAYEATEPGYDGNVSIPVLWDRRGGRIVSNNADIIDVDLATAFTDTSTDTTASHSARAGVDLYPVRARDRIDELSRHITAVDQTVTRAVYHEAARHELRAALRELDHRLATRRYLVGNALTLADIRLWVLLVRYDAGPNANGAAGPKLTSYTHLWAYARDLYTHPAFSDTTDFAAFTAPFTPLPDWTEPAERSHLSPPLAPAASTAHAVGHSRFTFGLGAPRLIETTAAYPFEQAPQAFAGPSKPVPPEERS